MILNFNDCDELYQLSTEAAAALCGLVAAAESKDSDHTHILADELDILKTAYRILGNLVTDLDSDRREALRHEL